MALRTSCLFIVLGVGIVICQDSCVTWCPANLECGNCSCQATCEDPRNENGCNNLCTEEEACVCPEGFLIKGEDCVPKQDCGCFLEGEGVIKDGDTFINSNCSKKCFCQNNQLTCENLNCSANATCSEIEGSGQCQCNEGFVGDGKTCEEALTDCLDLYKAGVTSDGVYTIYPTGWAKGFEVYCEMESNGGGWTVFQRRLNGTVDFYRNWDSYKQGFGILTHEFWLGNDKIHSLTRHGINQLRIDVEAPQGLSVYVIYNSFSIGEEEDKYRLSVGKKSGNTDVSPLINNNGQPFSTYDQDNDDTNMYNCAEEHHGGWWYKFKSHGYNNIYHHCWKWRVSDSLYCGDSNLNGDYQETGVKSIYFWYSDNDPDNPECGMTRTEMKLRPV